MHAAMLWCFYVLGGLFSMWKRASLSISNPHTPWENIRQYVGIHGPQLGINWLLSTALFWTWWTDASFLSKALSYVGLQTQSEFTLPLNVATAAVYGVFSDQIMDFIVAKGANKFKKQDSQQ